MSTMSNAKAKANAKKNVTSLNPNRSSNISHLTSGSKGNRASVPMGGLQVPQSKFNPKMSPIQERSETPHQSQISEVSKLSENTKMVEEHNRMMLFGDDRIVLTTRASLTKQ